MSEKQPKLFRCPHDKKHPYTIVSNDLIRDRSISPKAKGILIYLLHLPDDWQLYHSQLQDALNVGEEYLNSGLKELIEAGYAKRTREKVKGLFQPYQYEISELKRFLPDGKNRPGSSGPENSVILSTNNLPMEDKQRTTTTKRKVAVVSLSLEDKESVKRMKTMLDNYSIEWGDEFIIPIGTYENLAEKYGIKYVIDQFNYMCKKHYTFFRKRNSLYCKEKPIEKPEIYFKICCQENYANYKEINDRK